MRGHETDLEYDTDCDTDCDRSGMLSDGSLAARPRLWSLWLITSGPAHQSPPITLFIVLQSAGSSLAAPHREKNGHFLLIFKYFTATMNPI